MQAAEAQTETIDRFMAKLCDEPDGDLMLSRRHGFARQADMSFRVPYDAPYFDKYVGYEGSDIARAINVGRIDFVNRWTGYEAPVLDIGIGSGEFIKLRPNTFGIDVNPKAIDWLKMTRRWANSFAPFEGFTFWDVLEHVDDPDEYFRKMHRGAHVFVSLPIFGSLTDIRKSKHYRPGEHLYYFTEGGFVTWMDMHGFRLLDSRDFETRAGREDILSFAFRKTA